MGKLEEVKKRWPRQMDRVAGQPFPYRYHQNPQSDVTVVLLTGGIGLSDLMLFHFEELAKTCSVITFDYPEGFPTVQELVDAVAELLRSLRIKAYLVGQSLGGFLGQILAKQHPEVVSGLVLSNTGTLSVQMDPVGEQSLRDMLKRTDKLLLLTKTLPFGMVRKKLCKGVADMIGKDADSGLAGEFIEELRQSLTKSYMLHMARLLKDLENHWNLTESDFERYKGRVLLILSDDDETFHESVKQALRQVMPDPAVVTDLRGGHMALLKVGRYTQVITDFIQA